MGQVRAILKERIKVFTNVTILGGNGINVDDTDPDNLILNLELLNLIAKSDDQSLWQPLRTTEGLINQQTVPETYLTIDVSPEVTKDYKINTSLVWSKNTANDNMYLELVVNDDQGSPEQRFRFLSDEPKDNAGAGEVLNVINGGAIIGNANSGTDIRVVESYSDILTLTSGVNYTIDIDFFSQSVNDEAAIYKGYLQCIELP